MDRLGSMAAFVRTVECGSFAASATALGLSPQMVAKHVTSLEARLGARLLNRTTRKQSLTEIGQAYYERCKLVLAEVDWADSVADAARGAPRGRLRINAPVSFGAQSVTPMVARFLRDHPHVGVDLVLTDRFVDLFDEGFEAVFRIGPPGEGRLGSIELAPFRLVACASPAYLRERGTPATPADLAGHECLAFSNWPEPTISEWRFIRDGQLHRLAHRSRLEVNNAGALLQAALAGAGLAFIAEDLARPHLASGQLVRVVEGYEAPSRPIHLLFHPDRRQTPKLKSFIEAAAAQLGRRIADGP